MAVSLADPPGDWPHSAAIDTPTRLLLALTQAGEELEPAAATLAVLGQEDNQRLITLLRQQRLAPWVAYQLKRAGLLPQLPEGLRLVLERATTHARQRTARQRLALLHTVRCLQTHGIPAVALKGSHLAWQRGHRRPSAPPGSALATPAALVAVGTAHRADIPVP